MVFCAEPLNASGKKSELDAQFYDQTDIVIRERLKRCHELWEIFFSADRTGNKYPADTRGGQPLGPGQNLLPVHRQIVAVIVAKLGLSNELLDRIPDFYLNPVQQTLQDFWIESSRLPLDGRIRPRGDGHRSRPFLHGERLLSRLFHLCVLKHLLRIQRKERPFFEGKS